MEHGRICVAVETLRLDGVLLPFERAILFAGEGRFGDEWRISILDTDPMRVAALAPEIAVVATTVDGSKLAGRARREPLTPTGGSVQLIGLGPLLRCHRV